MSAIIERSWRYRRIAIYGQAVMINIAVAYILIWGDDNRLHQDIAQALILLLGALLNGYIFGAVWDDRNKDNAVIEMDAHTPPQEPQS